MLKALRAQVQTVLYAAPARRKPALRRSDEPDALLATDLPLVAAAETVEAFSAELTLLGWHVEKRAGWLILDAPVPRPETAIPPVLRGECGCCISLLQRHGEEAPAEAFIRAVVKASEAGTQPLEKLCRQLHGEFAVRLRRHEPLPGALLPYLCCAQERFDQR